MEEASDSSGQTLAVYLPHHPVMKRAEDGTPKVRVVFNASSPTSNGRSLNDLLLPGPKLQLDIFAVLFRWRVPRIALKADIAKMFRQIRVHNDDADLQRIVWRREPHLEPTAFRLTTVTYGTACAPYLAQRVLHELAKDEGNAFPRAWTVLQKNFYVDDVLFGAETSSSTSCGEGDLTSGNGRPAPLWCWPRALIHGL
ncbi:uncharacterized protein LOC143207291 [Lasioglossum baleicum]|uniref:uncharacterized protein LOC143207291 n=1 Tax=Lasioglossum baleicum TaxID=434251 RepID=UPI003FCE6953